MKLYKKLMGNSMYNLYLHFTSKRICIQKQNIFAILNYPMGWWEHQPQELYIWDKNVKRFPNLLMGIHCVVNAMRTTIDSRPILFGD